MVDIGAEDIAKLNSNQICVLFLFLMEYATTGLAIAFGLNLLCTTSSASAGFRFYGIILIIIGVVLMILCYVTCSLAQETELAILKSMCCSVPLFIALAALGIFALSVSSKGGGQTIPDRSYKEYHVESYSKWMQNKVNNLHHWENYYKKALLKTHVCDNFYHKYELDTIDEFHKRSLDAFEVNFIYSPFIFLASTLIFGVSLMFDMVSEVKYNQRLQLIKSHLPLFSN